MPTSHFKVLNIEKIEEQVEKLGKRVYERFPDSGLSKVLTEILEVARGTREKAEFVQKPIVWLRVSIFSLIAIIIFGVVGTFMSLGAPDTELSLFQVIQLIESAINDAVFIGVAVFFLSSLENRYKRVRALKALDELRSLAHVLDMHQLTKDPEHFNSNRIKTPSSPTALSDRYLLKRYLDYCTEALSLVGKLAAVYPQGIKDAEVAATVNEIETLTTGLSRKIWQKLIILNSMEH